MLKKAGFAHRRQCSEIWTASVTDLHTRVRERGLATATDTPRTNHYTLTVAHPQQVVFPCGIKRILGKQEGARSQMTHSWTDFSEKLSLIYRFPGGNIFLHKREDFVTLVERQTVEDVSQQDERSCGGADACVEGHRVKGQGSSSCATFKVR